MKALFALTVLFSAHAWSQCVQPTITSLTPGVGSIAGGANFTITGQNFCSGVVIDFGSQQAQLTGQTATQITGKIPANAPGTYPVTVSNPGANPAILQSGFQYVSPNGALVASAGSAQFGATRQTLNFFSYVAGGAPPYTYFWNFGDGQTGITKNGTHAYPAAKTYPVTLIVIDASNDMAFSTTKAYVSGPVTAFCLSGNGQTLTDGSGGRLLCE